MQHVADRDGTLLVIRIRRRLVRKERKQRLIELQYSAADRYASQSRGDRLRDRSKIMGGSAIVRIEIRVCDNVAVANHQQAVRTQLLS